MYKVILVDDEYMITEGLKVLIPFDRFEMEVVATFNDADAALTYIREHPVDVVITDVNMPGKNGLEMISEMKSICPQAAYIIMSGYQEFDYVKTALNLQVVDYLVKPVNKVELSQILEGISQKLSEKSAEPAPVVLPTNMTEAEWEDLLAGKEQVWLGLSKQAQGFALFPRTLLDQSLYFFLSDKPVERAVDSIVFQPPYQEHYRAFRARVEKTLFYGEVHQDQDESIFSYYEPIYRVIIQGNLQQILDELHLVEELVQTYTPPVSVTKQLFIQFIMDVFHLFEHLKADDMTQIIAEMEKIGNFTDLSRYTQAKLTALFDQYRMNENVATVLEIIGRDYKKELLLKDISKELYINPVYLGQLIKRETNSTFAELLNKQRIKAAQQLLLSTSDSIEDICYGVGYSNVGYFYKVFRKICGKSPKAYRKQIADDHL